MPFPSSLTRRAPSCATAGSHPQIFLAPETCEFFLPNQTIKGALAIPAGKTGISARTHKSRLSGNRWLTSALPRKRQTSVDVSKGAAVIRLRAKAFANSDQDVSVKKL